jgi:hypothetical protein
MKMKIFVVMILAVLLMPVLFSGTGSDLSLLEDTGVDSTNGFTYYIDVVTIPPDINQGDMYDVRAHVYMDDGLGGIYPVNTLVSFYLYQGSNYKYIGEANTDSWGVAHLNYQFNDAPGSNYRVRALAYIPPSVSAYGNYFTIHERPPIIGPGIGPILPKVICPNTNPTINLRYCPKESQ